MPEHITEYTIKVNGKIDPLYPVALSHEEARQDRAEWLDLSPNDNVEIVHRRVVRHDWALTTP